MNKHQYTSVIFLQNDHDFDSFEGGSEGFFNADRDEQLRFLRQWDYGDAAETTEQEPWGTHDYVEFFPYGDGISEYVLTTNLGMGYAGLAIKSPVESDDPEDGSFVVRYEGDTFAGKTLKDAIETAMVEPNSRGVWWFVPNVTDLGRARLIGPNMTPVTFTVDADGNITHN